MSQITNSDMEEYFSLDEDNLFTLLIPEQAKGQLYSKKGAVARGKGIFSTTWKQVRHQVCKAYSSRGDTIKGGVDLAVLIANALVGSPALAGIPILPFVTLLVKMGIEELCREGSKNGSKH